MWRLLIRLEHRLEFFGVKSVVLSLEMGDDVVAGTNNFFRIYGSVFIQHTMLVHDIATERAKPTSGDVEGSPMHDHLAF